MLRSENVEFGQKLQSLLLLMIFMTAFCVMIQEKALESVDKEESPESNDSDLEEVQVDRDSAMREKEKVRTLMNVMNYYISCKTTVKDFK